MTDEPVGSEEGNAAPSVSAGGQRPHTVRALSFCSGRTGLLVVLFMSLLVFLPGLGSFGILDPSDGLYMECSREMLELGNFLTPHFGYQPFLEKPILIYWAILFFYKICGVSEWAARLPSALSGGLCAVVVVSLTLKFIGRKAAVMAAIILISAPLFLVIGHLALSDMMVTLFMTTALLGAFARVEGGGVRFLALIYVCLGLLALTKGPVPVLFVAAIVALYLVCLGPPTGESWYRSWWRRVNHLQPIAAIIVVLILAAPWYLTENAATHGAFFQEFFIRQNLGRAAGTVNHQEPWNFYVPYLTSGLLPWWPIIVFAPNVIRLSWRHRNRPGSLHRMVLFCSLWSVSIICIFSLIKTKLPTYVLPACPPVAILAATTVALLLRKKRILPIALTFASALAALVWGWFSSFIGEYVQFADGASKWLVLAGVVLFAAGFVWGLILLALKRSRAAIATAMLGSPLSMALLIPAAMHVYDNKHDKPLRDLVMLSQRPDASAALFMRDSPSAFFYTRRAVPILYTADELRNFVRTAPGKHLLIVSDDVLVIAVQRAPRLNLLARKSKYTLFSIDK